ncbi:MAG: histidine phosphatase family protein [Anaerovorax sp.]
MGKTERWCIHLIRHGETEGTVNKLYYGSSDLPLTPEGVDALRKLVETGIYPKGENAVMYTSGLLRTEQTFALIYGDREHHVLEEFQELDFGEFEMKSHHMLLPDQRYVAWMEDQTRKMPPPGGESFQTFEDRIEAGFEKLKGGHKERKEKSGEAGHKENVVVVCHGGVIATLMVKLFQEEKHFYQWLPETGHGYTITMEGERGLGYQIF